MNRRLLACARDRRVLLAARGVLAAVLLWLVLRRCGVGAVGEDLRDVRLPLVGLALFLHIPGYLVSSLRWQVLLAGQGARVPLGRLFSLYLVGTFFNNFLPTTVGGDVMRVMGTAPHVSSKSVAGTVIVAERMTGLLAIALLALGGIVFGAEVPDRFGVGWLLAAIFLGCAAVCVCVADRRLRALLSRVAGRLAPGRAGEALLKAGRAFAVYGGDRRPIAASLLLSLVLQANVILYYVVIARALGLTVPAVQFFFIVPAAHLVMMIPITPNAVGVREGVFVFLLGAVGVAESSAVTLSWIAFALILLYAVVGGIVYAVRR